MNNIFSNFIPLVLVIIVLISCQQGSREQLRLFGEKSDDWFMSGDSSWSFDKGILTGKATGEGGFVMTKSPYSDFVLKLEFLPDSTVNSGVFIRCGQKELSASDCFEINIWDRHPNQEFRTGAIVTRTSPLALVNTIDQWNTYKIRCKGDKVEAWINDVKVAELVEDYPAEGYIALQAAGNGQISFRNVSLRPLGPDPG